MKPTYILTENHMPQIGKEKVKIWVNADKGIMYGKMVFEDCRFYVNTSLYDKENLYVNKLKKINNNKNIIFTSIGGSGKDLPMNVDFCFTTEARATLNRTSADEWDEKVGRYMVMGRLMEKKIETIRKIKKMVFVPKKK